MKCEAVIAALFLVSWTRGSTGPTMGPFDLIVNDIVPCEGVDTTGEIVYANMSRNGKGKASTFNLDLDLKQPLDDDISLEAHVGMWTKDGFKPNVMVQDGEHACKGLKKFFPEYMQTHFKACNVTDCPIPPGRYQLRGLPNSSFMPSHMNSLIYGKLRLDIISKKDGINVGCVSYFFDSLPKKSRKKP